MGGGSWDAKTWSASYASTRAAAGPGVDAIYKSTSAAHELDAKNVLVRESCDFPGKDPSTALIIALDVTGSMSHVLDQIARVGLGVLFNEIYSRKPVTDPQVMLMGIGDMESDRTPVQATQFEADTDAINLQLEKLWLERNGGGNGYESYAAAWLFAAMHTRIDCWEKRKKKGYLFTIGDELPTPLLRKSDVDHFLSSPIERDLTGKELFDMASQSYEVYHVIVEEGSAGRNPQNRIQWTELMGERAIFLSDHTKLAEIIVSAIQMNEGASLDAVVDSWSGDTSLVVRSAVSSLSRDVREVAPGVSKL